VIVAVPAATAVTVNVTLDAPAWMARGVCTVATAELLLDNETLAPPAGAAPVRLTVPWPLLPATMLVVLRVTAEMAGIVVGVVDELEPPH